MIDFDETIAEAKKRWKDLMAADKVLYIGTASCGHAAGSGTGP